MFKPNKLVLIAILCCFLFVLIGVPKGSATAALARPTVTLPSGWVLSNETAYPNSPHPEHDPTGAGFAMYEDTVTSEAVLIYYENSMGKTYTNDQLRSEAERIHTQVLEENFTESGVMTVAGVSAGYALVYNAVYSYTSREFVFIKGEYYFNVYAIYLNSNPAAMNIVNSISVPTQTSLIDVFYALIFIVIVAIVASALLFKKRLQGKNWFNRSLTGQQRATELVGRVATGYPALDNLLHGGLPDRFSVALTSPTCDERDELVNSFLETGAKNDAVTFCVTSNPNFGIALSEQFPSNFYLFICNPQAGMMRVSSPNILKLKGVENLTDISIALTTAIQKLPPSSKEGKRICISLVSDAVLYNGAVQARKWLTELLPELKSVGFTTLAVIDSKMHSQEDLYKILSLFDGEISINERQMKKIERFLKIVRMSNQEYAKAETILPEK
jgi:hypothetical protein